MKSLKLSLITVLGLGLLSLNALGLPLKDRMVHNDDPRDVDLTISSAFIPSGFDSSSDAYTVISGLLPNGCYRFKKAEVNHIGTSLHEVRAKATVSTDLCIMVLVPYTKEVALGKLVVGKHIVKLVNGDGTYSEKSLTIEE